MGKDQRIKQILDPVYVITRNGRRADPTNFLSKQAATPTAKALIAMVKKWDPNRENHIDITKTTTPHRIR